MTNGAILKMFEFGRTYTKSAKGFKEKSIYLCGYAVIKQLRAECKTKAR